MEATTSNLTKVQWSRIGLVLLAFHVAAFCIDRFVGANSQAYYRQDIGIVFLGCVLSCDAAFLCILGARTKTFPWRMVGAGILPSLLAASFIFWSWIDWSLSWLTFTRGITETFHGQCALLTILLSPLFVAFAWVAARNERRDWHWMVVAILLTISVGICALSSTSYDYISTRSRGWWLDRAWINFFHVVLAAIVSFASVVLCAWVLDHCLRRRPWWIAAAVIMSSAIFIGVAGFLGIITNRYFHYSWNRGYFATALETLGESLGKQGMPVIAAITMLAFCLLLALLRVNLSEFYLKSGGERVASPLMHRAYTAEDRRYRLWRLASFALGISLLNLVIGFYEWLIPIERGVFGDRGIFFEFVFLAPLGLWSAQMAASAIFLECKIWNIWKRSLVILAWAELSMLAYWGQVALSNSIRWNPSDYVGALLHVVGGALALCLAGVISSKYSGSRIAWKDMESAPGNHREAKPFSISLSDIICLVTVSAGVIYPFSVIFSVEHWQSPVSLFSYFLYTAVWPLITGAAGYFALRAWLGNGRRSFSLLAGFVLCLLASCSSDYSALTQVGEEQFFGIRYSLRFMALPWFFVGAAIAAMGLRRCGFSLVQAAAINKKLETNSLAEVDVGSSLAQGSFVGAPTNAASPWD